MLMFYKLSSRRTVRENLQLPIWRINIMRTISDRCEPMSISWQWRAKNNPDIQRCSPLHFLSKECPKKRFFPRFWKKKIYENFLAWPEPGPPPRKQTWSEYFTFLLPDIYQKKPPYVMCRKLLETRRRQCLEEKDLDKAHVSNCCWPLPNEWFGQSVLHVVEPRLPPPVFRNVPLPLPPPSHKGPTCALIRSTICPPKRPKMLPCLMPKPSTKIPFSKFKGAPPKQPKPVPKCQIRCIPEIAGVNEKSTKLSCISYSKFKTVECPTKMFTRFLDVDLSSNSLTPIPVSSKTTTTDREVKKGACERTTLLRPAGIRNYHTSTFFMNKMYEDASKLPEFKKEMQINHRQPSSSAFCIDKMLPGAGMSNIPAIPIKPLRVMNYKSRAEMQLEKQEELATLEEEIVAAGGREAYYKTSKKRTPLQKLMDKQKERENPQSKRPITNKDKSKAKPKKKHPTLTLNKHSPSGHAFHTSATNARKSKGSKKKKEENDSKICSGCPGIRAAMSPEKKGRCSSKGRGTCPGPQDKRLANKPPNPYQKAKSKAYSPCNLPREKICVEEYKSDLPCKFNTKKPGKHYHTSAIWHQQQPCRQTEKEPEEKETERECYIPNKCTRPRPKKRKPVDWRKFDNIPQLPPCPHPPGYVPKTAKQLEKEGCFDGTINPNCTFIERIICKIKKKFL